MAINNDNRISMSVCVSRKMKVGERIKMNGVCVFRENKKSYYSFHYCAPPVSGMPVQSDCIPVCATVCFGGEQIKREFEGL